jgi:uncharacterized SAM-binding protein YcdF (DUF218 family)
MLILTKILPLLVLPPFICIMLAVAGLVLKRRLLVWLGLGLLWVLSLPVTSTVLMRRIEGPFHRVSLASIHQADAIVVLSGMIAYVDNAPLGEWGDAADRFDGGIDLYKAGKAPVLVFTAGQQPWQPDYPPEGELLTKRAVLSGVPRRRILLTSRVVNTAAEAVAAARLLEVGKGRPRRIIIVTSAFHMQRAAMLFRSAGFEVEPYPVDIHTSSLKRTTVMDFIPDSGALDSSVTALREMIGLNFYRIGIRFASLHK